MTLKEFLKLNNNRVKWWVTVGVTNSTSLLARDDLDKVPQHLMDKKVVGWAVDEGQEIIIQVEDLNTMKKIRIIDQEVQVNTENKDIELTIQFKKRDDKTYEVWSDDENGGDYIRSITADDIHVLCAEIESENDIMNMSPRDFISMVWDLCSYKIFEYYDNFDYYGDNFKAFSDWFDSTVITWYCEMVQGLI